MLGPGRSGSSLVAGVLHKLGVHMGERLIGADRTNPYGHYEDFVASQINRYILTQAGGNWSNPPSRQRIMQADARAQIGAFVARRNARRAMWGIKDPRLALTIRHWEPHLSEPLYVWCLRPRQNVAASMMRAYRAPYDKALALADRYDDETADYLQDKRRWGVVHQSILDSPAVQVAALAQFVGVEVTAEAVAHVRPANA